MDENHVLNAHEKSNLSSLAVSFALMSCTVTYGIGEWWWWAGGWVAVRP